MNKFSLVGSPSLRTYFYLIVLKKFNILLDEVLIYNYKDLDLSNFLGQTITYKEISIEIKESFDSLLKFYSARIIEKNSINDLEIELKSIETNFFIFSGKGGEIVNENILKLNRFLHIHPGNLPSYRGSTTIYYSILKESKCFASAFFLDTKIDTGKIIKQKEFDILDLDFDYLYDPFIRSLLLIEILVNNNFNTYKQEGNAKDYYIIHPILKKLALLKKERIIKHEKNI